LTHVDEDRSYSGEILVVFEDQLDPMLLRNNLGSSQRLAFRKVTSTYTSWDK